MERELKLQIDSKDLGSVRQAPLLAPARKATARPKLLTSTYFDTPDLAIHGCKASLRVRAVGRERMQTLKLDGAINAGVFDRDEFEMPVDRDVPNLKLLHDAIPADTDCGKLVHDSSVAARLAPVFVTRIHRSTVDLKLPSGDEIEAALDEGTVQADTGSTPIASVELELKRGKPQSLYTVALELLDSAPLRIEHRSKADVGYELLVAQHEDAVKATPVRMKKRDSVEEAFCTIARNCLAQVNANERGVVSGHDPSCVHQMRVGLRRLRSALDLFAKVIPAYAGLDDELRWIAGELGAARDWEVLAGATLSQAGVDGKEEGIRAVREASGQVAVNNRQRAADAVNSVRYTRVLLRLTLWLETRGWREAVTDEQRAAIDGPVVKFGAKVLRIRHRKLVKRGERLADLDDHRRHRARIAAKKVRYATEFFASLYPKSAVRHYIDGLASLQDDLGWRNDAVVADKLLLDLSRTAPETIQGAAFARGYLASRVAADHHTLKALWKGFRRLSPPQ
ncbi:CHAD domain-containing protein [Paraburkholderia mimosarum]|uniref:CYTH and CHAD domain-containing protein n=1 Tax=Paraburkholderia mimosarum TaxID=312026 RepID=UPI0039C3FD9E